MSIKKIYHKGQKFNKLEFLEETNSKKQHRYGLFKCICGKINEIRITHVTGNKTQSCGCQKREHSQNLKGKPAFNRKNYGEAYINHLYSCLKHRAKIRKLELLLTRSEFENIILKNCFYCNEAPNQSHYKHRTEGGTCGFYGNKLHHGIDRFNSNEGYTLENSKSCCKICNRAKSNMHFEDFKIWINKIYERTIKNES